MNNDKALAALERAVGRLMIIEGDLRRGTHTDMHAPDLREVISTINSAIAAQKGGV